MAFRVPAISQKRISCKTSSKHASSKIKIAPILRDVLKKCKFKIWSTKPSIAAATATATGYWLLATANWLHATTTRWVTTTGYWLLATATAIGTGSATANWLLATELQTAYLLLLLATATLAGYWLLATDSATATSTGYWLLLLLLATSIATCCM